MFSDLFYLSSLLELSLAFSDTEKQDIFNRAKENHGICTQAIITLEKEVATLTSYSETRKIKLSSLNTRTQGKMNIIEEVQYGNSLKNRFQEIQNLELQDND